MIRGQLVKVKKGKTYTTNRYFEGTTKPHTLRKDRIFAVEYVFASDGQVAERLSSTYENYYKPEDVVVLSQERHHPTYCGRREVGRSPIRGFGSIYMSKVKCECGWQNERCANQKECEEAHARHIESVIEKVGRVYYTGTLLYDDDDPDRSDDGKVEVSNMPLLFESYEGPDRSVGIMSDCLVVVSDSNYDRGKVYTVDDSYSFFIQRCEQTGGHNYVYHQYTDEPESACQICTRCGDEIDA